MSVISKEKKKILEEHISRRIRKRDWEKELQDRAKWIKVYVNNANSNGVILGNSGGKDCALVSILCKKAGVNVLNISMPCGNMKADEDDAVTFCKLYDIPLEVMDLQKSFDILVNTIKQTIGIELDGLALANIKPRLRMTTLYSIAQNKNYLVAGTGNRSETSIGYFTKWGDGASDFNPISDLTVSEIYAFLRYIQETDKKDLSFIIDRNPSAGLYEGQTDELELGFSYLEVDSMLLFDNSSIENRENIYHKSYVTRHKRRSIPTFVDLETDISNEYKQYNYPPLV